jgi:hypothetical protein
MGAAENEAARQLDLSKAARLKFASTSVSTSWTMERRRSTSATMRHSRRQLPIQFLNHLGQFRAKELVHLAQAALGVEGGVFKVVYFNAKVGGDVVADHF